MPFSATSLDSVIRSPAPAQIGFLFAGACTHLICCTQWPPLLIGNLCPFISISRSSLFSCVLPAHSLQEDYILSLSVYTSFASSFSKLPILNQIRVSVRVNPGTQRSLGDRPPVPRFYLKSAVKSKFPPSQLKADLWVKPYKNNQTNVKISERLHALLKLTQVINGKKKNLISSFCWGLVSDVGPDPALSVFHWSVKCLQR